MLTEGIDRFADDTRSRMFGEEALWYQKRGAARTALGLAAEARDDLHKSLAAEGRRWVHGQARLDLGRLALKANDRAAPQTELKTAISLCESDNDQPCANEARRLLRWTRGPRADPDVLLRADTTLMQDRAAEMAAVSPWPRIVVLAIVRDRDRRRRDVLHLSAHPGGGRAGGDGRRAHRRGTRPLRRRAGTPAHRCRRRCGRRPDEQTTGNSHRAGGDAARARLRARARKDSSTSAVPFWLLRLAPNGRISLDADSGIDFDAERLNINLAALEGLGPGSGAGSVGAIWRKTAHLDGVALFAHASLSIIKFWPTEDRACSNVTP